MKKLTLGIIAAALSLSAAAQTSEPCGFTKVLDYYRNADPTFQQRFEETFATENRSASKSTGTIYRIPVVFHVVYNVAKQNLHDSVIMNQLQILNQAFRHTHSDTDKLRPMFKPLAGDAEIEFYMATIDPDGKPTTGITRTQTSIVSFADIVNDPTLFNYMERVKKSASGGIDPWPTNRYMNIWIADLEDVTYKQPVLAGYATPPTNPIPPNWQGFQWPPLGDGVVMHYQVVGNNNPHKAVSGHAGRNCVHEVGHFLGLRHIWGDPQDPADTCGSKADDGIADTPPQAAASDINASDCTPYANQNTCGAGMPGDMPDLWENYMDYSNDKCQNMFTVGQTTHMRSILTNQRVTLTYPLAVSDYTLADETFDIYPQPASNTVYVQYDGVIKQLNITDMMGRNVLSFTNNEANVKSYDVSKLSTGNYIVSLQTDNNIMTRRILIQR
ncbi:MAG: T9SS type A sorting domain-containing protein [Chitinophagales bacterium]|nr:zinc-dependent metalloprotease [Chitinophagaceae bacterium]MCB9065777.1 T9SS type A sorting domain-containing protein [Chitinophagales bacterium]